MKESLTMTLKKLGVLVDAYETPDEHYGLEFDIRDGEDDTRYATVWTNENGNVEWDCEHPDHLIEFGDEDEQGVCKICGATCDWHCETDDCEVEGESWVSLEATPDKWYCPEKISGVLKTVYEGGK